MRYCILIACICCLYSVKAQTAKQCDSIIDVVTKQVMYEKKYTEGLRTLEDMVRITAENNYLSQHIKATNNLGLTYMQMLDYGNAIKLYTQAYKLALKSETLKDDMQILNNIAIVYAQDHNREKANEYFQKAFKMAGDIPDTLRQLGFSSNLAKLNLEMKNFSEARNYIEFTLNNYKAKYPPIIKVSALATENQILLEEEKYDKVIANCPALIKQAEKENLHAELTELKIILLRAYKGKNNLYKAKEYLNEVLKDPFNNEFKRDIFDLQAQIAVIEHDAQTVFAAKDSIAELSNVISRSKHKEILENSKLQFELAASQHELQMHNEKAANERLIFWIISGFLFLILLILGWVFQKKKQVDKQQIILTQNSLKIADLELEQEKQKTELLHNQLKEKELLNALELEKRKEKMARLQREVEKSNKILSDKILFQSTRNEMIENVVQTISEIPEIKKDRHLHQSVSDLKFHLKEDTKWDEFTTNFEDLNSEFLTQLKQLHPNLNANDIRFLSFIFLNLTYKEIAILLNISPETCRKRKERITKKLDLDAGLSLYEYLSSLSTL